MGKTIFNTGVPASVAVATLNESATVSIAGLSDNEMNTLTLASDWGVAVPQLDLAGMSVQAKADQFDSIKMALKKVMMANDKGREQLGAALIDPLKTEQDYTSVLRRAFKKYELGAGQENFVPIELDVQAHMISVDGDAIITTPFGLDGVEVPLQTIETDVYFKITDIKKGKYDLLGSAMRKAETGIFKEEDRRIANLFRQVAASDDSNDAIGVTKDDFKATGIYTIISAISLIEGTVGLTLNPTDIWMNPVWKQVFRSMTNFDKGFQVSFNSAEDLMKRGIIADFQGLRINQSSMLAHDQIYVTADPDYFGAFVESVALLVVDAVRGAEVGFVILEEVGFAITNPKGLSTIMISE